MPQFVIPTIFTAVDLVSAPVLRMEKSLLSLTTIGGASGAALTKSLNGTSMAAMEVGTSAAIMGAAILIPLGLATKAAMDFEKQMGNVATLVDTTKESIEAMGDSVLALAAKTPVPIHDLTESLYQLRSEGYGSAQSMELLEVSAHLAVAGLSTATEATKSMATAMRVFGDEGLTANQIANTFFQTVATGRTTMAQINESFGENAAIIHAAGVTFKEFQAATAALTNGGLSASTAQTDLAQSTLALTKPSGEMIKIFTALGYQGVNAGRDIIKAKGGIVPAMLDINAAANKAGISIEEAFGRKQGLIANELLTGLLNPQFAQDFERMGKGANDLATAYEKQLGTTSAQAQLAKNNLATLGIRIGELLLPALTALLKIITPITQGITWFVHTFPTLSKVILYPVAALGLLSAGLGAISLIFGTLTRSVFFTKIAMGGLSLAISGLVNVGVFLLTASLTEILGAVGLVIAAIAAFSSVVGYATDKEKFMTNQLDLTQEGFAKIKEPINDATIALNGYNKAVDQYNKSRSEVAFDLYEMRNHPIRFAINKAITNPTGLLNGNLFGVDPATLEKPKMSDFPGIDEKQTQKEYLDGYTPGAGEIETGNSKSSDTNHTVTLNLNLPKGVTGDIQNNSGPVAVVIGQTGRMTKPYTA